MFAAFLITLREVIEATLIVATILGVCTKIHENLGTAVIWAATISAVLGSIGILGVAGMVGVQMHTLYTKREPYIEGFLMITSAIFITWAVFFLHTFFAQTKGKLLKKTHSTISQGGRWGLFLLVFLAVFREGFEVMLFLSTTLFTSSPITVWEGCALGFIAGLGVAYLFYKTTIRVPLALLYQTSSLLLIGFGGYLITSGIQEFMEVHIVPSNSLLYLIPFAYLISMILYIFKNKLKHLKQVYLF